MIGDRFIVERLQKKENGFKSFQFGVDHMISRNVKL